VLFRYYQCDHRVDRVPGFVSSRSNWDPSLAGDCAPPLFVPGGGGNTVACAREEGGGPN
jgi:hypothetical protein